MSRGWKVVRGASHTSSVANVSPGGGPGSPAEKIPTTSAAAAEQMLVPSITSAASSAPAAAHGHTRHINTVRPTMLVVSSRLARGRTFALAPALAATDRVAGRALELVLAVLGEAKPKRPRGADAAEAKVRHDRSATGHKANNFV